MNMRASVFFACAAAFLAACDGPGSHIARDDIGPGPKLLDPLLPGEVFAQICLTEYPNLQAARNKSVSSGFTPDSTTGTYYNNRSNISVKITEDECSLVFGSKDEPDVVIPRLAKGTVNFVPNPPRNISITSRMENDGLRYYRMGIPSS